MVILVTLFGILLIVYTLILIRYRQRRTRQFDPQVTAYEMEGNPCYESAPVTLTGVASEVEYEAL